MSFDHDPESPSDLDLCTAGMGTVVAVIVLPELETLLGVPAFGRSSPISLSGLPRPTEPIDGWSQFGSVRDRGFTLH